MVGRHKGGHYRGQSFRPRHARGQRESIEAQRASQEHTYG
jgi:hypothetical protein